MARGAWVNVLITGGSGFVATNLAEALLRRGENVVLFSRHSPPALVIEALSRLGTLHLARGDVRDRTEVASACKEHKVDALYHAAAITADAERERISAREVLEVNVLGTQAVLEAARDCGLRRLVYLSSSSVYGKNAVDAVTLDESATVPWPANLYGISKYAGEMLSLRFGELRGMDVRVARVDTTFGPWERDTGVRDTPSPLMQVTRLAVLGREAVLPGVGRRDWLYSRELAAALIALMDKDDPRYRVYNIGPGREWTVEEYCRKLGGAYPRFSYRMADEAARANVDYYLSHRAPFSVKRLVEDIGYVPRYGLQEAFADYMPWVEQYGDLWTAN